jgi:ribulose-5-phosphate 4-epimerase/fuculose-1-phosphate aldolase
VTTEHRAGRSYTRNVSDRLDPAVAARTRVELAAAFRWTARLGWHEAVANHFSAVVDEHGTTFLVNPIGRHFSRVRASELVEVDAGEVGASAVPPNVDPTAWFLHGHIHRTVPHARVVMHTHMRYATTLACLADTELVMLDQNACRFHERVAYDRGYAGMALDSEGERIAKLLLDGRSVVFLGNHGVLVVGDSVAAAFDELYYLEKACELQVLALSTGRPLAVLPDDVAELTCRQWQEYGDAPAMHFAELMAILDDDDPSYAL